MIRENLERNYIIFELWKKGQTINDISFNTGIPRSTVGYYVRKFNKRAKSGEPIAFLPEREKPDEKEMAYIAFNKNTQFLQVLQWVGEGKDGIDRAYKFLMIAKLLKELKMDIYPTMEERKALDKYGGHIFAELLRSYNLLPDIERALNRQKETGQH